MLIGMSVVFLFLTLLVMLMSLTGAIVRRLQPVTASTPTTAGMTGSPAPGTDVPIGVVLAAVGAHHRKRTTPNTTTGDTK
jgi:sodium pump decarboxylase gamma subunit